MTRLVLVRHGETIWHVENRYAGSTDIPLSEGGLDQARRLAKWAAGADLAAIWVSPLRRARETAASSETATDIRAHVDSRLREIDFGRGEGLTNMEIRRSLPEAFAAYQADPASHPLPGGEEPQAVVQRAIECFNEIERVHSHERVLIVTHNTLIRVALCELLGIPLSRYRTVFPSIDNGALSEIRLHQGRTALLKFNVPLDAKAEHTEADELDV